MSDDPERPSGPLGFRPDDGDSPEPGPEEGEAGRRPAPRPHPAAREVGGFSAVPRNGKYVAFVFLAGLAVIAYVSITGGSNHVTARGLEPGMKLPPFAAPLALGSLEGDVNVADRPDQGQAGRVPACTVRGPDILNICQMYERGPVVLTFAIPNGERCVREIDLVDRVRRAHPGVQFAAIALTGSRNDVRRLVLEHRWRMPVGHDKDGALAALYGVIVCPVITYALPGGRVFSTSVGETGPAQLERRLRALEAAARRGGWAPRT